MPLGLKTIWPVGLGATLQSEVGLIPVFPLEFSPLAGSIDITPLDPHNRMTLGDGYEHRQRESVAANLAMVSMEFIAKEGGGLEILEDFLKEVGFATAFRMFVPGVDGTVWFLEDRKKVHIANRHWKVSVSLKGTRRVGVS